MIRLFVVEDQKIISSILKQYLENEMDIRVVGIAKGVNEALRNIDLEVDIVTLDVELEDGTGLEFLEKFKHKKEIPVIMLSSFTVRNADITLKALLSGAFDFVSKADGSSEDFIRMIGELKSKITAAYAGTKKQDKQIHDQVHTAPTDAGNIKISKLNKVDSRRNISDINIIAIGASTGGVQALEHIFKNLRGNIPPVVVVQHLPVVFTGQFTERLNKLYSYTFVEVVKINELLENHVYIATGDHHLEVFSTGDTMFCQATMRERVNGHRPSVDILFNSIAESPLSSNALGIILTGMGKDGTRGLLAMKEANSFNIGQSENSCVVYGMPHAAYLEGALHTQMDIEKMPEFIMKCIDKSKRGKNEKITGC